MAYKSRQAGVGTIDFGSSGANTATLAITGQKGIVATSAVFAQMSIAASADHSLDEHTLEDIDIFAGNIVVGTGFTIYATARGPMPVYGVWNVSWRWL